MIDGNSWIRLDDKNLLNTRGQRLRLKAFYGGIARLAVTNTEFQTCVGQTTIRGIIFEQVTYCVAFDALHQQAMRLRVTAKNIINSQDQP